MISAITPNVLTSIVVSYNGASSKIDQSYDGEGNLKFVSGHEYKGEFCRGRIHGYGIFEWKDGTTYEGEWKNNKPDGTGTMIYPDDSSYHGGFKEGKRNGKGTFEDKRRRLRYVGDWRDGKREGEGISYYDYILEEKDDRSNEDNTETTIQTYFYKGEWLNDKRHGKGVMAYSSGNKYDGEWENDQKSGYGVMYWMFTNQKYIGQWKNDKQNGKGKHMWLLPNDSVPATSITGYKTDSAKPFNISQMIMCNQYEGEWLNGLRHGKGVFLYADGSKYEGNWESNLKQGKGKYIYNDGRVYEGEFLNDRIVEKEPAPGELVSISQLKMDMSIEDLFLGKQGIDRGKLKREVENIFLRWNEDLHKIYLSCSQLKKDTESVNETAAGNFTLTLDNFHYLLRKCEILDDSVTLAAVNRIVHKTINDPEYTQLHSNDRRILFREFSESILRIANVKYSCDDDLGTPGLKLLRLLNEKFKHLLESELSDEFNYMKGGKECKYSSISTFNKISVLAEEPVTKGDMVVTPRVIIQCLKKKGFIGSPGYELQIQREVEEEDQTLVNDENEGDELENEEEKDQNTPRSEKSKSTPRSEKSKSTPRSEKSKSTPRKVKNTPRSENSSVAGSDDMTEAVEENSNDLNDPAVLDNTATKNDKINVPVYLSIDVGTAIGSIFGQLPSVDLNTQAEKLDTELLPYEFDYAINRIADSIHQQIEGEFPEVDTDLVCNILFDTLS